MSLHDVPLVLLRTLYETDLRYIFNEADLSISLILFFLLVVGGCFSIVDKLACVFLYIFPDK